MSKRVKKEPDKKICVSSLVLGIIGLVFSAVLPVVSYACAIPGLIAGIRKSKKNYNSTAGISLSIIALIFAAVNSALGIVMTLRMFLSNFKDKKSLNLKS